MTAGITLYLLYIPVVFAVFYYWKAFQTFFNPVSLFLGSFLATITFAYIVDYASEFIDIYGYFRTDPADVTAVYLVGFAAFLAPWALIPKDVGFFNGRTSDQPYILDSAKIRITSIVLSLILVAALAMTFVEMGGIPVLSMFSGTYSYWEHVENLYSLPVGLMALNLLVTFTLALHLASFLANPRAYGVSFKFLAGVGAILLVSASWQGNRQIFLILAFFLAARRLIDRPVRDQSAFSITKLLRSAFLGILVVALFLLMFIVFGVLRLKSEGGGNPFDILAYFAWPFYNMMSILEFYPDPVDFFPHYVLSEFLPARFGGKDRVGELSDYLFEPSSPSSYFGYWFLDFGVIGVAFGSLALGWFSRWAFTRRLRGEVHMRIYLLALWCCATVGVYSHFISLNYFLLPVLVQAIQNPLFGIRRLAPKPEAHRPDVAADMRVAISTHPPR